MDALQNSMKKGIPISVQQSNLFKNLDEKFDTIIFNPPYLPSDPKLKDLTLDGGKKGYELIQKFLKQAKKYLEKNGIILFDEYGGGTSNATKGGIGETKAVDEFCVKEKLKLQLNPEPMLIKDANNVKSNEEEKEMP